MIINTERAVLTKIYVKLPKKIERMPCEKKERGEL